MVSENKKPRPLFVDLDGTLVSTDTLWESCLLYIKGHPLQFWRIFVWLFRGKAYFKEQLALNVNLNAKLLPYNDEVMQYISNAKAMGGDVYLLTAANQKIADDVANHLGLFSGVFGSTEKVNLSGKQKLKKIRQIIGSEQFDYIGDSKVDVPIWDQSNEVIMVDPADGIKKVFNQNDKIRIINTTKKYTKFKIFIKGIRVHQWAKNALLFLPIIMAHQFMVLNSIVVVLWAFISFSLCASAVYIINDLLDIETDRKHPTKKNRPLASGLMSVKTGIMLILLFLIASILISLTMLSTSFLIILVLYMVLTTAYSVILKQVMLIDVIVLGGLYTLRIIAGSVASGVYVSSWLLVFSMFFFLSLAFMKRYADLILMKKSNRDEIAGRGYHVDDLDLVQKSGITSGYVAMLVLALYVNSDHIIKLYKSPILVWFIIPALFYWLMKMWMVTNRGEMTDDPINYAIRERTTYVVMVIIGIVMLLAATIDSSIFNNLNIIIQ